MPKALFIDRDGILNETLLRQGSPYSPSNWDEIRTYDEMKRLPEIKAMGFVLLMVTNQPDIERGLVSEAFVAEVHKKFQDEFSLDGVYCCPFSSNDHPDKKPNPGLFLRAQREWSLDLSKSFHLGDTARDTGAAKNCGCGSILWERPYNGDVQAQYRIKQFDELKQLLGSV